MSTYVCSDIHGNYKKWKNLLKKINFSSKDRMHVIGDVIDRGPDGIKIFLEIFNSSNITLYLGNHEEMMLNFIEKNKHILSETFNKKESKIFLLNLDFFDPWIQNGGFPTLTSFLSLSFEKKLFVFEKLKKLPVINVGMTVSFKRNKKSVPKEKMYYLAHANHGDVVYRFSKEKREGTLYFREDIAADKNKILWDRSFSKKERDIPEHIKYAYGDMTLIVGHTPPRFVPNKKNRVRFCKSHFINLDCRCYGENPSLSAVRLEDLKEFHC